MNNSKIQPFEEVQLDPHLERESFLVRMIESIQSVVQNLAWKEVQTELYDDREQVLAKRLRLEAEKAVVDLPEVYRLQGRLSEVKRFNLEALLQTFKVELENIKKRNNESN